MAQLIKFEFACDGVQRPNSPVGDNVQRAFKGVALPGAPPVQRRCNALALRTSLPIGFRCHLSLRRERPAWLSPSTQLHDPRQLSLDQISLRAPALPVDVGHEATISFFVQLKCGPDRVERFKRSMFGAASKAVLRSRGLGRRFRSRRFAACGRLACRQHVVAASRQFSQP